MYRHIRPRFYRPRFETLEDRNLLAVTWPVPASHEMSFGFGAGSPDSLFDFHEGIDILADGQGGQPVVAARGGTVYWNNGFYAGGMVVIEVDVGGGMKEYDQYYHVENIVAPAGREAVAGGTPIAMGAPIGEIAIGYGFPDGSKHMHFQVLETVFKFDFTVGATDSHSNHVPIFTENLVLAGLGFGPAWRSI